MEQQIRIPKVRGRGHRSNEQVTIIIIRILLFLCLPTAKRVPQHHLKRRRRRAQEIQYGRLPLCSLTHSLVHSAALIKSMASQATERERGSERHCAVRLCSSSAIQRGNMATHSTFLVSSSSSAAQYSSSAYYYYSACLRFGTVAHHRKTGDRRQKHFGATETPPCAGLFGHGAVNYFRINWSTERSN